LGKQGAGDRIPRGFAKIAAAKTFCPARLLVARETTPQLLKIAAAGSAAYYLPVAASGGRLLILARGRARGERKEGEHRKVRALARARDGAGEGGRERGEWWSSRRQGERKGERTKKGVRRSGPRRLVVFFLSSGCVSLAAAP
jgi:hypothetical protein